MEMVGEQNKPHIVIDETSFYLEIREIDETTLRLLETWYQSVVIKPKENTKLDDIMLMDEPSEVSPIPAEVHTELLDKFIKKQKKTEPAATTKKIPIETSKPVSMKICSRCKKSKPLDAFAKSKKDKFGHQNICREDMKIYWKHKSKDHQIQKLQDIKSEKHPSSKPEKQPETTEQTTMKTEQTPVVDNHLSKKMLQKSTGGDWDTTEMDVLQENFFLLGGAEGGALKIYEKKLLPGRTVEEITNMAKHQGMM